MSNTKIFCVMVEITFESEGIKGKKIGRCAPAILSYYEHAADAKKAAEAEIESRKKKLDEEKFTVIKQTKQSVTGIKSEGLVRRMTYKITVHAVKKGD